MAGVEPAIKEQLAREIEDLTYFWIADLATWESSSDKVSDFYPDFIICGSAELGVSALEMAQYFRAVFPTNPILFVSTNTEAMHAKNLLKNGFTEAYLLPGDNRLYLEKLNQIERAVRGSAKKMFRGVALIDVQAGDQLDFPVSIFLPLNKKYIAISKSGQALSDERLKTFREHDVRKVFVDVDHMEQFYKYTAGRLKDLTTGGGKVSETERQERLNSSIRQMVLGLFDQSTEASFDAGRQMMDDLGKIVTELVGTQETNKLFSDISLTLGQPISDSTRGQRMSTYASLFELALGGKQVQQVAIAALFADIGMSGLPIALQNKDPATMNVDELTLYRAHPEISLRIMMNKKMVVAPEVQAAILQHHERLDGSGFPKKLMGNKISRLSQIVALASRFDDLATFEKRPLKDPLEILTLIQNENIASPEITIALSKVLRRT